MSLTPGFRLAQYEILEPIGSGGMGEVYKARDSRLDRDVAIKVMAPHIAADPEMRRRFETEARAVAALSHSSIVAIHELAVVDDVPLAVMELNSILFSAVAPPSIRTPAPRLGEHTEEILTSLGLSREDISRLRAQKVIG